ncbi:MAG: AAA family ATPase [Kiritimatiellae bacterium]|nr:AAA family ATPase [Kiritimatiellia bacterium]
MAKKNSQSGAKLPALPVGNSNWAEVKAEYWSADKTQLISGLLDKKATVSLFTRPRRFGKTFAMRMLKSFFEKTEKSNADLFRDTKVWRNAAHRAEQGKYPVIFITFKDAKGSDWAETREMIADAVRDEYDRHRAAFMSEGCLATARQFHYQLCEEVVTPRNLQRALGILAAALHAHHGERPVILIDEYDSPINHAATHGFGEEALQFFRNFLSGAMKDGEHCRLGVITGILRVAKEGVLSGLNNLKVYSVFDEAFSDCFGFTEDEVRAMLATFGHPERIGEAKDWYDGYLFGGQEIYNPWSLLNYVDDGFKPRPYWTSTSSNDLVSEAMARMTPRMRGDLADFFEKKKASVPCSVELGKYGTIQNNPQIIWSLLVHTGYLKVLSGPNEHNQALLAFPNRELVRVFRDDILDSITCTPKVGDDLRDILDSLTSGETEKFRTSLEAFLVSSASYFDTAKEDFFHGLLLGLLALGRDTFEIASNREGGDGRPDILMKPRPGVTLPGVILELKSPAVPARASQKRIDALLASAAKKAREQIDEKRYAAEMEAAGIAVLKYGIGFSGKRVALAIRG